MRVLVTGANGFIGSNVVKRLLEEEVYVNVLVRKTSDLSFLKGFQVNYFYGDITDYTTIEPAVRGVDKVIHVAGLAADWGPYELFEKVNYKGTINVAKAAAAANVKRFVYISTVAFHGFGKTNVKEDDPPARHLIPYAETKLLAEQWLWEYAKVIPMEITAVRPGNVFGPNDRTFMLKYIDAMSSGKFGEINRGRAKTCPVYVENLVNIIMLALKEQKAAGNAYLATDGLDITWHEFNSLLAKKLGLPAKFRSVPYGPAMVAAKVYYGIHSLLGLKSEPFLTPYRINNGGLDYHFSIKKLEEHFGYKPETGIDKALDTTVEWYRKYKKEH
jgi:nucleoside-diphosphate-sugar epimerase